MSIKIYHYPKCSTSNSALSFLKSRDLNPEVILYCENGLKEKEILDLMKILETTNPIDLIKRKGITYRNLGLAGKNFSNEEWIKILIENPKLLQRPIIILNNKGIIGPKIETIDEFLTKYL